MFSLSFLHEEKCRVHLSKYCKRGFPTTQINGFTYIMSEAAVPSFPSYSCSEHFWKYRGKSPYVSQFHSPNFIALGIYFIVGTKISWNEGIDTVWYCFNVECILVTILIFLVVTWWLLPVTGGYCLLQLVTAPSHFKYERRLYSKLLWLQFSCICKQWVI